MRHTRRDCVARKGIGMGRGNARQWAMTAGLAMIVAACGRGDDGAEVAGTEVVPSTAETIAAPTTVTAPATTTQVNYVVQSGDSLSVIAGRFGVTTKALADFNAISDVNSIVVGQELSIPPTTLASATDAPATEASGEATTTVAAG